MSPGSAAKPGSCTSLSLSLSLSLSSALSSKECRVEGGACGARGDPSDGRSDIFIFQIGAFQLTDVI